AAAAVLLVSSILGIYFYTSQQFPVRDFSDVIALDKPPGGNNATVILDDGSQVPLSTQQKGIIIGEEDVKYADGSHAEEFSAIESFASQRVQAIQTPYGGQYHLVLPDGSQVWLNAGTTLRMESDFVKDSERKVRIDG